MIVITVVTIATPYITATNKDDIALYIIRKAANCGIIPKKNEKSLKLSLGLLIEISLVNLITDLINDLINIL